MNRSFQYVNLVIAFVAALAWNHKGNPGGRKACAALSDDIEEAFFQLRLSVPTENAWHDAEELRAQAFAEAVAIRDAETS